MKKSTKDYSKQSSQFKLWVKFIDGRSETFYSYPFEDKKGIKAVIAGFEKRLINKAIKGKYSTAIVYENISNSEAELHKWVYGKSVINNQ